MTELHGNGISPGGSPQDGASVKEEDDEFAALGGKTRLVSRKSPPAPSSPQGSVAQANSPSEIVYNSYQVTTPTIPADPTSPCPMDVSGQWHPGYPTQDSFEFPYPAAVHEQWHPEMGYVNVDPAAMSLHTPHHTTSYPTYSPVQQPMTNGYLPTHPQMDGVYHGKVPVGTDNDASWRNLFAQFNQA